MTDRAATIQAFLDKAGWGKASRRPLAGDASFRKYERLSQGEEKAVLMDAPPPQEDVRPFIRIATHLTGMGYSAPKILAQDEEAGLLLLEDLGDGTFTRLLASGERDEEALYALAVDFLVDLHTRADSALEGLPVYDEARLLAEASLLTDWYWPAVFGRELDPADRVAFLEIWRSLIPAARALPDTLVLRDFHVDNLMALPRNGIAGCGVLDFQDAVAGPPAYDLMSLLEDARRDIDPGLVARMKDRYLARFPTVDRETFERSWAILAAQRHTKVIGIFTRLARRDGKPIYLEHIPRVWRLLEAALAHPALATLALWLDTHIPEDCRIIPSQE
jgi:aminoglycoside/choline kinase family phosphotransferase